MAAFKESMQMAMPSTLTRALPIGDHPRSLPA
jgi:hypothetical protein